MGSETHDCYEQSQTHTTPKLPLLISRPSKPPELPMPKRETAVSVPFKWEEAPGKPRPCYTESEPKSNVARALELPPRLLFSEAKVSKLPSPTTVLDGPYVGRAMSFTTSYRSFRELGKDQWNGGFGSSRWSNLRKNKEEFDGSFDFWSPAPVNGNSKVKITKVSRTGSLFSPSQPKTHLWASIYDSLKQVVPWGRRPSDHKQRKLASKFYSV